MAKKGDIQPVVCILGTNTTETSEIRRLVNNHAHAYRTEAYASLIALKSGLTSSACMAAILDLDSVPLDNRTVCTLASDFPSVRLLCTSRHRFHPELKDAITRHLFACMTKPIDPDELHYFLRCIRDDFRSV